ncbi:MAG TPA: tyrosine-type recombinase/integrase [Gammaproteobacteria bacterium]|nr:tyrosine-type recombinase/integrase [Gammaproteobacteria bacterium]
MARRQLANVEEHPKGSGRFRVRARIGGSLKTIVAGVPRSEAEAAVLAYETTRDERALRDGITLAQFGHAFFERRARRGVRGVKKERDRWSLMVARDPIGTLAIRTLLRSDVLDWLDRWAARGRQTRRNALNLVRAALDEALDRGLCEHNVARDVKIGRAGRADETEELGGVLELHEQAALLAAIPPGLDREAVAFALYGGLRQGSQWALRREDCRGDTVLLRRHKSGRARVLHLLPPARDALARSLELATELGSDFAFPAPGGGQRSAGHKPYRWSDRRAKDGTLLPGWLTLAGITRRVRWHDLRHTCATSLLAGWWGDPPRKWTLDEVCSYMQHSSVKVTERYARKLAETTLGAVTATKFPGGNSGGQNCRGIPAVAARCKTVTRRFESDPRLSVNPAESAVRAPRVWEQTGNFPPAAWALALAAERVLIGARPAVVVRRRRARRDRAG